MAELDQYHKLWNFYLLQAVHENIQSAFIYGSQLTILTSFNVLICWMVTT